RLVEHRGYTGADFQLHQGTYTKPDAIRFPCLPQNVLIPCSRDPVQLLRFGKSMCIGKEGIGEQRPLLRSRAHLHKGAGTCGDGSAGGMEFTSSLTSLVCLCPSGGV